MSNVSIFVQILSVLPKDSFRSIIQKRGSDRYCKGYDTYTQLISMIFCHLAQCLSVRDLSNCLRSIKGISHLGISASPSKSSVAYQNKHRDHQVFGELFHCLVRNLRGGFHDHHIPKIRLKRKIFAMDSSLVTLCLSLFDWAAYTHAKGAVKLHTVLDFDGMIPVFLKVTDGKQADIDVARTLRFPKGSVVLIDRGYLDFKWLRDLDSKGVFFVTRLKRNILHEVLQERPLAGNPDHILLDANIRLLGQQTAKDYPKDLRIVRITHPDTGEEMTFLTNNMKWKAETIAELYRQRWQIEAFFKQIKQHLKVKSFIGTTQNAVIIQLYTAMMTILLLKYLKEKAKYGWHMANLVTFLRINLLVKTNLWKWIDNPFPNKDGPEIQQQLTLFD